jgi:DNA invertase Pin-like site-specific DNA recombinase
MVAIAFVPNPYNKPFVNHKNGIKSDNRKENLEWVTKQENELHSTRVLGNKRNLKGLKENWENPIQAKKVQAILPNGEVRIYKSHTECAKDLKVSRSYVSAVLNNVIKKNTYNLTKQ